MDEMTDDRANPRPASSAAAARPTGEAAERVKRRILVVEDEDDLRLLETMLLEQEGFDVRAAEHGQRALECVACWMPDLVLLDMKMPVMNGAEFARLFRARLNGHRPPIVVITAAASARRSAAEIGADGWLGKPFDPDDLLAKVRSHLAGVGPTVS